MNSAELNLLVTPEVLKAICKRSEDGEGVVAVLTEMFGEDKADAVLVHLRDNHRAEIIAAKQVQLSRIAVSVDKKHKDGAGG